MLPFRRTRLCVAVAGLTSGVWLQLVGHGHPHPTAAVTLAIYPCVFPGCITKAISLVGAHAYICITQSYWLTDPSLPEKLKLMSMGSVRDGSSVNGAVKWRSVVCGREP